MENLVLKVNESKRKNPEKFVFQLEKVLDRYFPERGVTLSQGYEPEDLEKNQFTMIISKHEKATG